MSYFEDIYLKRLNRFGTDYQSRIQGQREKEFENLLLKSPNRVSFLFNEEETVGLLKRYKQDETRTLQYLLVRVDTNIPGGTILSIPNKDGIEESWMIFFLEKIKSSGYNRYILIRMTHYVSWIDKDGNSQGSLCYLFGPGAVTLRDELISGRTMMLYSEDRKSHFMIMPTTKLINKDDYVINSQMGTDLTERYLVTGLDIQSTLGVAYISIDPTYERDLTPPPQQQIGDNPNDFYWFKEDNQS